MKRPMTLVVPALMLLLMVFSAVPVLAAPGLQQRIAQNFMAFTPYPAQEIAIGESANFGLTLRTASDPQIVRLDLQDLPDGWTATFKGGGRIIEAAYVEPENDTKVSLSVDPPADVAPGTYKFTVVASGDSGANTIPIELTIKDKLPPSLDFGVDLPTLKGAPDTTFRFNATLKNKGDEDLVVNLVADAPAGMQVNFTLSGQDVTSFPLAANESKHITVEVKPFSEIAAGDYPINVLAQGGEAQSQVTLTAEVTGQPQLALTEPDGRLSGQAYVGDTTPLQLVVQNNGSAAAHNIQLSANPPSGWDVQFQPKQIPQLEAGKQVDVTANIKPADQAVAGDYVVTVKANSEEVPAKSTDFRITVLTSTLWGIVGIGLIAVAVVVVGLAVMRFGRR